jgi:chromosomal replication initiator protein
MSDSARPTCLQAIAAAASRHARNPRVVYLTAEYFMWRFATAIRDNDALVVQGIFAQY